MVKLIFGWRTCDGRVFFNFLLRFLVVARGARSISSASLVR